MGKTEQELKDEGKSEELIGHCKFSGNRPSTVFMFKEMTAFSIGQLYAIYEHRTVVEGFIWDINSFDQWGVQLGKVLATNYRTLFSSDNVKEKLDAEIEKNNASAAVLKFISGNL